LPAVQLASVAVEPLVLQLPRNPRAVVPGMRHGLEHVFDRWPLPRMQPPLAVDLVSPLRPVVAARRLV